jgi:hypothetical protein
VVEKLEFILARLEVQGPPSSVSRREESDLNRVIELLKVEREIDYPSQKLE